MQRRTFMLQGAGASLAATGRSAAAAPKVFRPEAFGAKGDGRTDDTEAFGRMSRAVNQAGGGIISLSRCTYMVGHQKLAQPPHYLFEPLPIIDLEDLSGGVTIEGDDAILRAIPGGRYGSFDTDGQPLRPKMPFLDGSALASPYRFMIRIARSRGPVQIRNLELDGNIARMHLGGGWGDTGWQIPMTGIALVDNVGDELLADLFLHDHGQDGMLVEGSEARSGASRQIVRVRSSRNGRQGCSIVGGSGYRFIDCEFTSTGRGVVTSAPGAGVDIEAEGGKQVFDLRFTRCVFEDNHGAGMVADSGPSRDVRFTQCRFVGKTNWSAWPSKPGFQFDRCLFAGAVVRAFGSENPKEATQFVDCAFVDRDPRTGSVVYGSDGSIPMVDLGGSYNAGMNVAFIRCRFEFELAGKLPWTGGSVYESVYMRQSSAEPAYPRGVYRGHNVIHGSAILASSRIEGSVELNGRQLP